MGSENGKTVFLEGRRVSLNDPAQIRHVEKTRFGGRLQNSPFPTVDVHLHETRSDNRSGKGRD